MPGMSVRNAIMWVVRGFALFFLLLGLLLLSSCPSKGQPGPVLAGGAEAKMSVWAQHQRCYQHSMSGEGRAKLLWGPAFAEGFLRVKWWGACDAKIPSSFLNAEAGKVIERWHGVNLGVEIRGVQIGGTVRRDAVHHIWRHKDRHNYFPESWQVGRQAAFGGDAPNWPDDRPQKASLGYYDGAGPFVGYEGHGLDVELTGPQYRWKSLTLPWPEWTLNAEYMYSAVWEVETFVSTMHFHGFRLEVYGQAGGPAYEALSGEAILRITRRVGIGVRGGRIDVPGWSKPVDRLAISLELRSLKIE